MIHFVSFEFGLLVKIQLQILQGLEKDFLRTVLQTDTGELVEYTTAIERTVLKELGKLTL